MVKNISVLLLCGDTNRAKAYINILKDLDHLELNVVLYGISEISQNNSEILLDDQTKEYLKTIVNEIPDLNNTTEYYLKRYGLLYSKIAERDVNSDRILNAIKDIKAEYVIFAGYGGQILSKSHFKGEKKYVHCHPGWLPQERGSTTIYYSLLNDRPPSVTAFFMSPEIDKGGVLVRKSFPKPFNQINIDVYTDNLFRAETLKKALLILGEENYEVMDVSNEEDEEFYIIHPLLKHISLLSLSNK